MEMTSDCKIQKLFMDLEISYELYNLKAIFESENTF